MGLIRIMAAPLGLIVLFVVLLIVGFASTQTGWVALALFCVWPLIFAAGAWSFRGLRDNYQLISKQSGGQRREARRGGQEVLN